jgi:hypothetical protein
MLREIHNSFFMQKKFELILTLIGLVAITALALVLSTIEKEQMQDQAVIVMQEVEENLSEKDLVYQGYQDYRVLEPQHVDIYAKEFFGSILSEWKMRETVNQDLLVSEIRIHYFEERIRYVILFETSPSGDWIRETEYYFAEDGQIGVLSSRLNTFYGNVSVLEQQIYLNGELIDLRKTTTDLDTLELVDRSYQDQPIQVFTTVDALLEELNL